MARLSATEVARRFSEMLKRVAAGEEIEVTRAGAPVAVLVPPRVRLLSAALAHGFGVVTRNRADFERVRGLRVIAP